MYDFYMSQYETLIKTRDAAIEGRDYITALFCQLGIMYMKDELGVNEESADEDAAICLDMFNKITSMYDINADEDFFVAMLNDLYGDEPDEDIQYIYYTQEKFLELIKLNLLMVCCIYNENRVYALSYIDNLLESYKTRFGHDSEIYLRFYLAVIGEFYWQCMSDRAVQEYIENENYFKEKLSVDNYLYVVMLRIVELIMPDDYKKAMDIMGEVEAGIHTFDCDKDIQIQLRYLICRLHLSDADTDAPKKRYLSILDDLPETHSLYPAVCRDLSALYMMERNMSMSDIYTMKGLHACDMTGNKKDDAYIELMRNYAGIEYTSGRKDECLNIMKQALDTAEEVYTRYSYMYLNCLSMYIMYIDDYKTKGILMKDFIDVSKHLTNEEEKDYAYMTLSLNNFNIHGSFTLNSYELEAMAKKAYDACKSEQINPLEANTALVYLRTMIAQPGKYYATEEEIKTLISKLTEYFKDDRSEEAIYFNMLKAYYNISQNEDSRDEAIDELESLIDELNPDDMSIWLKKYIIYIEKGEYDKALILLIQICRKMIENEEYNLGMLDLSTLSSTLIYIIDNHCHNDALYMKDVYEISAISKFLSEKYNLNYLDNAQNDVILKHISELEFIKMTESIDGACGNVDDQIRDLRNKLNYAGHNLVNTPSLKDIKIPDQSVVIDIHITLHVNDENMLRDTEKIFEASNSKYKIFLLRKNGQGDEPEILALDELSVDEYNEFFELFEEDTDEALRQLYEHMFGNLKPYLEGVETIYISSAEGLSEIPFDILIDDNENFLVDSYDIVYCESVFDIKEDFNVSLDKPLIIGAAKLNNSELNELPYAEIECVSIANMLNTHAVTGHRATKSYLLDNAGSSIIHISSHGNLESIDAEKWITPSSGSYVLLAGKGLEGILTAEELSRIDLSSTDLITLAACNSGSELAEDYDYLKGLRWAALHAGANAVVAAMWEVDDMETAIFMIIFYRELMKTTLFKAFNEAKRK